MENNLQTKLNTNHWLPKYWFSSLIIGVLFLFISQLTYGQRVPVPCTGTEPFTIIGEDAKTKTSNDAKMRISGAIAGDDRIGYTLGNTYTGTAFAATAKFSTLTDSYISQTLPTPTATTGTEYTIRVYKADTTCFYDKVFTLEYVNFPETPKFPDIQLVSGLSGGSGGFFPLGSTATVSFTAENAGDTTATNLKLTLNIPAGLTLSGSTAPAGTTYNPTTKEWTIGSLAKGTNKRLDLTFTVGAKGLSFVSANTTTQENIMLANMPDIAPDKDSQPGNNVKGEDDYGSICISSPYDLCEGDEYKMTIASGNYTGIKWFKNGTTEITSATAAANGVIWNGDGTITIKSEGIYSYSYPDASCPDKGCCPIKVEAGVAPDLQPIANQTVCLNQPFAAVVTTNTGYTGPTTLHPNGDVVYQWYNDNGTNNPTTTSLDNDKGLTLTTLPTAVGVYKFKLVSYADGHKNCKDSVMVTLTINALPQPILASTSPVCEQSPLTLTATPTGATNYAWTGPGTFASNVNEQTFASAALSNAGTYMVTVTNGLGCSATATTAVIVNPKPAAPVVAEKEFCAEDLQASLSAPIIAGQTLLWYGNSSTGGVGSTTASIATPNNAGVTRYYVSQKNNITSCESNRSELVVTVHEKPKAPQTASVSVCKDSNPVTLDISQTSTGYTVLWYGLNSTGGVGSTTKDIAPTNTVGTTNYYVSWKDNTYSCESNRATIPVEIRVTPVPTLASNSPVCAEKPLELTASPAGATTYAWSGPSGFTGSNIANPVIASAALTNSGNYAVTVTNGTGCSATASTNVIVNPLPDVPQVTAKTFCEKDAQAGLEATALANHSLLWYGNSSTGGVSSTTTPIHNPISAGFTRYYATQVVTATGCESYRNELLVNVNPKPSAPLAEDKTYCQDVAATALTVSGAAQHTFLWYGTNSTGGTSSTVNPVPFTNTVGTTTYYVSQKNISTGCESNRDNATVTVNRTPAAPVAASAKYCQDATADFLTATSEVGNTVIWYDGGVASTTAPKPSTLTAGLTYFYVKQIIPGTSCESGQSAIPVTIDPKPVAEVLAVSSLCIGTDSQGNGKFILTRYRNSDEVIHYNTGSSITGTTLPIMTKPYSSGVFASNLQNPTVDTPYMVRIKNSFGCTIDKPTILKHVECGCPGGYCEPATISKIK